MYRKIIDPDELYVSELLKEGYSLHSVTPFSYNDNSETQLVYHFIKEFTRAPEASLSLNGLKFKAGEITEDDRYDNLNWHENQ